MSQVRGINRYYGAIGHRLLYMSNQPERDAVGAETIVDLLEELTVPDQELPIAGEIRLSAFGAAKTTEWRIEEPEGNQHDSVRQLETFYIRSTGIVTGLREQDLFFFLKELNISCKLTRRNDQPLFAPYTTLPPHLERLTIELSKQSASDTTLFSLDFHLAPVRGSTLLALWIHDRDSYGGGDRWRIPVTMSRDYFRDTPVAESLQSLMLQGTWSPDAPLDSVAFAPLAKLTRLTLEIENLPDTGQLDYITAWPTLVRVVAPHAVFDVNKARGLVRGQTKLTVVGTRPPLLLDRFGPVLPLELSYVTILPVPRRAAAPLNEQWRQRRSEFPARLTARSATWVSPKMSAILHHVGLLDLTLRTEIFAAAFVEMLPHRRDINRFLELWQ